MSRQAHAEALYHHIQALLGEHNPTQVQTTLERGLRHILPPWSEQKPDVPGWYWHKPSGISEPRLLLVGHGRIDTKLMADLGPPNNLVDVQRITGHWAGPLLPPDS